MIPIAWLRLCLLLAAAASSMTWVVAAESYIAVFDRGSVVYGSPGLPLAPYGYATLTLSEFSDLLCYSILLEDLPDEALEVQLLLNGKGEPFFAADVHQRSLRLGEAGGCLGSLSADQRIELGRGSFRIRVLSAAFPEGKIEAHVVSVGSAAASFAVPPEHWAAVAAFLELDDRQWSMLQGLLQMQPPQWQQMRHHLRTEGRVQISSSGLVSAVSPGSGGAGSPHFLTTTHLQEALTPVTNFSNQAKSAVSSGAESAMSVVKGIDLPRPDGDKLDLDLNRALEEIDALVMEIEQAVEPVREWIVSIQNSPWAARLGDVREALRGDLARGLQYLKMLRSDYVDFLTNPQDGQADCGLGSECDSFREKLLLVIGDVQTTLSTLPRLGDVEIPVEFRFEVARRLILATPEAGLFLMSRIEKVFPDWQSRASQISDLLVGLFPPEPESDGFQRSLFPAGTPSIPIPDLPEGEEAKCLPFLVQRHPALGPDSVYLLRLALRIYETVLLTVSEFCPIDSVLGGTAAVGARGTVSRAPCRMVFGGILGKAFTFVREQVDRYVSKCQSVVFRSYLSYENNLRQCRPLPGLWLAAEDGGALEKVRSLVQLRREQVFRSGLNTGFADLFLFEADRAAQPDQGSNHFKSYNCLCNAYEQLRFPTRSPSGRQRCDPPRFEQVAFRGRNDDGGEADASAKAPLNTGWHQLVDRKFRVRFAVRELWGQREDNFQLQLQYRLERQPDQGWRNVSVANKSHVRPSMSEMLNDGDDTTQQISGFLFISPNGGVSNGDARAGGPKWDFAGGDGSEAEFTLVIPSRRVLDGDRIQLRVVHQNGQPLRLAYSQVPEIQVSKP